MILFPLHCFVCIHACTVLLCLWSLAHLIIPVVLTRWTQWTCKRGTCLFVLFVIRLVKVESGFFGIEIINIGKFVSHNASLNLLWNEHHFGSLCKNFTICGSFMINSVSQELTKQNVLGQEVISTLDDFVEIEDHAMLFVMMACLVIFYVEVV